MDPGTILHPQYVRDGKAASTLSHGLNATTAPLIVPDLTRRDVRFRPAFRGLSGYSRASPVCDEVGNSTPPQDARPPRRAFP
jgi:hypothetical protein